MQRFDHIKSASIGFWLLCVPFWSYCANSFTPGAATILLSNYESNRPILYWSEFGLGSRAPKDGTRVQVLTRPIGGQSFSLACNAGGVVTFTLVEPGFFESGEGLVVDVTAGDSAEFYFRAWRGATDWEAAIRTPAAFVGQSATFTNRTGIYDFPGPSNPAPLVNAPSFTIYPVPLACQLVDFIGPQPLCLSVSIVDSGLRFNWTDLGTDYVYTLQSKDAVGDVAWQALPGSWPSRTNAWTVSNPEAGTRFYRVQAELKN
jgi:hypothetical protein